jgi:hypothetical protein
VLSDKNQELLKSLDPHDVSELWEFFTRGYVEKGLVTGCVFGNCLLSIAIMVILLIRL